MPKHIGRNSEFKRPEADSSLNKQEATQEQHSWKCTIGRKYIYLYTHCILYFQKIRENYIFPP